MVRVCEIIRNSDLPPTNFPSIFHSALCLRACSQGSGRSSDQTVRQSTGGPSQTGSDRSVHHSPAQLVTVPHVQPRVHAGQGLLHIQRHAQATGPVPDASRPRLQAYVQPRGFRYGYVDTDPSTNK